MLSFALRARSLFSFHCAAVVVSLQVRCGARFRFSSNMKCASQAPSGAQLSGHMHFGCCLNPLLSTRALLCLPVSRECPFAPMWPTSTVDSSFNSGEASGSILKVISSRTLSIVTSVLPPSLSSNLPVSDLHWWKSCRLMAVIVLDSSLSVLLYTLCTCPLDPAASRESSFQALWRLALCTLRFGPTYLVSGGTVTSEIDLL